MKDALTYRDLSEIDPDPPASQHVAIVWTGSCPFCGKTKVGSVLRMGEWVEAITTKICLPGYRVQRSWWRRCRVGGIHVHCRCRSSGCGKSWIAVDFAEEPKLKILSEER